MSENSEAAPSAPVEAPPAPPEVHFTGWRRMVTRPALLSIVVLMGVAAPLVYQHLTNLWKRPHYQFCLPLMLAAAWLIFFRSVRRPDSLGRRTSFFEKLLLALGIVFLAGASLLFTPWLAAVSFLCLLGSFLLRVNDPSAIPGVMAAWLLLWLLIPPPFGLDDRLGLLMQRGASVFSSRLMDRAGVNHIMEGNVIQLPRTQLLVEEACSGIQSLLSMVSLAALYAVARRRSPIHTFGLMCFAVIWSTAANALRVAAIAVAFDQYHIDLAHGWQHTTLGLCSFALATILMLSTDGVLSFFLSAVAEEAWQVWECPMSWYWNRYVAWTPEPQPEQDPDLVIVPEIIPVRRPTAWTLGFRLVATGFFVAFAAVCGLTQWLSFQQIQTALNTRGGRLSAPMLQRIAGDMQRDFLPALPAWQLAEFSAKEREELSVYGHYSRTWSYTYDANNAVCSFDYPFEGWHELPRCYRGAGWRVKSQRTVNRSVNGETIPIYEVEMIDGEGTIGCLHYAIFRLDGEFEPRATVGTLWRSVLRRIEKAPLVVLSRHEGLAGTSLPTFQFQLFTKSPVPLSDVEREDLVTRFAAQLQHVRTYWQREIVGHPVGQGHVGG